MAEEHILVHDIIDGHSERMDNLKKYYPFFKLCDNSLSQYKDGRYAKLDMGYITLAILRFFIEQNQFNDRAVTYEEYEGFMKNILTRDFKMETQDLELKELISYIFDKVCNEGKPFTMNYFDPVSREERTLRVRLIEGNLSEQQVLYHITSEAIEFYLDTKEMKDESRINVQQLLLEKMISSKNFKGGLDVVKKINSEIGKLILYKNDVLKQLNHNVFEGMKALEEFLSTGLYWFDEEQRLFQTNKELIDKAMEKTQKQRLSDEETGNYRETLGEIHRLDVELKKASQKHSELLNATTQLQIQADEIIAQKKKQRFRNAMDFTDLQKKVIEKNDASILKALVEPLFGLNIHKTLNMEKIDDMLSYAPESLEHGESVEKNIEEEHYQYLDEIVDERIRHNFHMMMKVLFDLLLSKKTFDLSELNHRLMMHFTENIMTNGDYYSFLVHLCQKKEYVLKEIYEDQDTFMEGLMAGFLEKDRSRIYERLVFKLEFLRDKKPVEIAPGFSVSDVRFERISM